MKLNSRVYVVGSGDVGFSITEPRDCTVFLVDGGNDMVLIDAGIGDNIQSIINNIKMEGLNPEKISRVLLTHGHADHSGGAYAWKKELGVEILAHRDTAKFVTDGDEHAIALAEAKEAGAYEKDYVFHACPVTPLDDGAKIKVGDLELTMIETLGHCDGHASYYCEIDGKKCLFGGDLVFQFGRIILQNIWDCRIPEYAASMEKIKKLKIDSLFAAHGSVLVERGYKAVEAACAAFDTLGVPQNLC